MPYQVNEGQQVDDGAAVYSSGAFVPGPKGSLADMEAVGVVTWHDAPKREPQPKPAAKRKAAKR